MEKRPSRNYLPRENIKPPKLSRGRSFIAGMGLRAVALLACPGDDIAMFAASGSSGLQGENQPAILTESPKVIRVERAIPMGR